MSYSHCKTCWKTIHNSDLESSGLDSSDCPVCGLVCPNVDIDTDGDIVLNLNKEKPHE